MEAHDRTEIEANGEIVVFSILKPSACAECGAELWKGSFLRMEKAEAALSGMRGSGPSGVSATGRCCADAPQPEVFDLVCRGGEVQPFSQKVRASRLTRRIRRPRARAGRMPQRRRKAPSRHGRRPRSLGSEPTTSTSRNSWIAFGLDTQIALRTRLKRLRSTRVRNTAGELAALLRQSRLMRRQLTLRSRLTFVIRTPTTIGYYLEGGNERRRDRRCRREWRQSWNDGVEHDARIGSSGCPVKQDSKITPRRH